MIKLQLIEIIKTIIKITIIFDHFKNSSCNFTIKIFPSTYYYNSKIEK